jgi:hypothetical protein
MRLIRGLQDTRTNGEDFALTPYLGLVKAVKRPMRLYGLSLTWGYYTIYLGLGFSLPKSYPNVFIKTKNRNDFKTKTR